MLYYKDLAHVIVEDKKSENVQGVLQTESRRQMLWKQPEVKARESGKLMG
jgi:hypothetical protein